MVSEASAASLLRKLGEMARALDPEERELFAGLIGPGVAAAIGNVEVEPFGLGGQESDRLAQALAELRKGTQPTFEEGTTGSERS